MYAPRILTVFSTGALPDPPVASDDTVNIDVDDSPITFDPTTNDTGSGVTITSHTAPTGGSVTRSGNNITYTPPATAGTYTMTYTITDSYARTDVGTVTFYVTNIATGADPNEPPLASMTLVNIAAGSSWATIADALNAATPGQLFKFNKIGALDCAQASFTWSKSGTQAQPIGFMADDVLDTELQRLAFTIAGAHLFIYGFKMTGRGHKLVLKGQHCAIHRTEVTGWGAAKVNVGAETSSHGMSVPGGGAYWMINRCHIHHPLDWNADEITQGNQRHLQMRMGIRVMGKALGSGNPFSQHGKILKTQFNDQIARVRPGDYNSAQTDPVEVGEDAGTYSYANNMDILLEDVRVLDCHDPKSSGAVDVKAPGVTFRRLYIDNPNAANMTPRVSIRAYGKGTYEQVYFGKRSFGAGIWGGENKMYGCVIEGGGNATVYICPGNSPHDWDNGWSYDSYNTPGNPNSGLIAKPIHTTNRNKDMIIEDTDGKIEIGNTVSDQGRQYPTINCKVDTNCSGIFYTQTRYSWSTPHPNNACTEANSSQVAATRTHEQAVKVPADHCGPTSTWYRV